jgi:hypothetical protein
MLEADDMSVDPLSLLKRRKNALTAGTPRRKVAQGMQDAEEATFIFFQRCCGLEPLLSEAISR